MLVLYPAVLMCAVCNVWFDSQALVLTAAKEIVTNYGKTPPSLFPISYYSYYEQLLANTFFSVYVPYSYS